MVTSQPSNVVTIVPGTITSSPLPVTVPEGMRGGLKVWAQALGLPKEQRTVFADALAGKPVAVPALADAIMGALAANATRYGQSMMRRYGREPLVLVWAWLRDTQPTALLRLDLHDPLVRGPIGSEQQRAVDHANGALHQAQHRARMADERAAEAAEARRRALTMAEEVITECDTLRARLAEVDAQRQNAIRRADAAQEQAQCERSHVDRSEQRRADAVQAYTWALLTTEQRARVDAFSDGYDAAQD